MKYTIKHIQNKGIRAIDETETPKANYLLICLFS